MLLNTIRHAGRKIFLHFHDEAVWKEEEHPRAKGGQFTSGAGVGPKAPKPNAAKGAIVVNPIAKVLKEHGYEKQKGQQGHIYRHPQGHEVEAHAASEGQQWLTGWTHTTTGHTSSGAGKLAKHLASINHNEPPGVKEEPPPATTPPPTPPSKPPISEVKYGAEAAHSQPIIHNLLKQMGFEPAIKTESSTTYEHPTKGAVSIANEVPSSGNAPWKYYATKNETEPYQTGEGILAGSLQKWVSEAHPEAKAPPPPPPPPVATPTPPPPPPVATAPSVPMVNAHSKLDSMGFVPKSQGTKTTVYVHPTKGKVEVNNTAPKSGPNKGKATWKYFLSPSDYKPIAQGKGVVKSLAQTIESYNVEPPPQAPPATPITPEPPATSATVSAPKGANKIYPNYEQVNWSLTGVPAESDRHWIPGEGKLTKESLIIGKGETNKGQWQIWTKEGGVVAQGTGQQSLNEAFEKLHPRGAGGKFVAKPGSQEAEIIQSTKNAGLAKFANELTDQGYKPTSQNSNEFEYTSPDNTIVVLSKKDPESWNVFPLAGKSSSGFGLLNLKAELEGVAAAPPAVPSKPVNPAPGMQIALGSGEPIPIYAFPHIEPGKGYVQEQANKYTLATGEHLILSNKSGLWEITSPIGSTIATGTNQQELNKAWADLQPSGTPQQQPALSVAGYTIPQTAGVQIGEPKDMFSGNKWVELTGPNGLDTLVLKSNGDWVLWKGSPTDADLLAQGHQQDQLDNAFKIQYGGDEPTNPDDLAQGLTSLNLDDFGQELALKGFSLADESKDDFIFIGGNGAKAWIMKADPNTEEVPWKIVAGSGAMYEGVGYDQLSDALQNIEPAQPGTPPTPEIEPPKVEHFTANSMPPPVLNGIPIKAWTPPAGFDWTKVEGQNEHLPEPQMDAKGKKPSAGLLIVEPDGRVWLAKPTGEYNGVKYTFPKGGQDPGESLQATAIREAYEETGLKAEITAFAGDYLGETSMTRYYFARRTGGDPTKFGAETQQMTLVPPEELGKYLHQARDLQILKEHLSPKAIGRPIHLENMTKISEKKGSNPGGVYQSASGTKYYVKLSKSELHTKNELLAADLMSKAGGGTLQYHPIIDKDGKLNVGTEWQELHKDNANKLTPAEKKRAQQDFAVNAWLANWDAAGTGGDNTGITQGGKAITIDVGGALLFRAQGDPKGPAFGYEPSEWETLRNDPVKNPDAYKLYHDMTPAQLKESAEKLNNVTNQDIHDAVFAHFDAGDLVATGLVDKLIKRRDKILQYASVIPGPKPTVTAPPPTKPPPTGPYSPTHAGTTYLGSDTHSSTQADNLRLRVAAWNAPGKPSKPISQYKGHYYDEMNALMRHGDLEEDDHGDPANNIRAITTWLDKCETQEDIMVWRGVPEVVANAWDKYVKVGKTIRDRGFQSCATYKPFSDGWRGPKGRTILIRMPKGTHAGTVRNTNESDGEYEVLLQRSTVLRVNSWQPGNYDVTVEQPNIPKK